MLFCESKSCCHDFLDFFLEFDGVFFLFLDKGVLSAVEASKVKIQKGLDHYALKGVL